MHAQFPLCDDEKKMSVSCLNLHYSIKTKKSRSAIAKKDEVVDPLVLVEFKGEQISPNPVSIFIRLILCNYSHSKTRQHLHCVISTYWCIAQIAIAIKFGDFHIFAVIYIHNRTMYYVHLILPVERFDNVSNSSTSSVILQ